VPKGAGMSKRLAAGIALLVTIGGGLFIVLSPEQTAMGQQVPSSSLIVKLVDGLSQAEQEAVIARNGGVETSSIPALRLHVLEVSPNDLPDTLRKYQSDTEVLSVEVNKTRQAEATPSDPLYTDQWALPKIGWDSVFGYFTPSGSATVAVLDTGVDASHPDLTGKVIAGTSILDGSDGLSDPNGHGTWLAGIVAAETDNSAGVAGVGYAGVQVMPVVVLGSDATGQDSDIIKGVVWAADHGADVILMGFSNPGFSQSLEDAIDYAWSKGAVLVAATGNGGVNAATFPAGDRGVIGVSATDPSDNLASSSNYGQDTFLAAPGTDIYTTGASSDYVEISGTSASAAIVAGAAAFMRAMDPDLANGVVVGRLARTADTAGTQDQTGNGRINMARALADTSTDSIEPAGAAPVGSGGPYDTDRHADPGADEHTYGDTDSHPDGDTDRDRNADQHPHGDTDQHIDPYADAIPVQHHHRVRHQQRIVEQLSDPRGHEPGRLGQRPHRQAERDPDHHAIDRPLHRRHAQFEQYVLSASGRRFDLRSDGAQHDYHNLQYRNESLDDANQPEIFERRDLLHWGCDPRGPEHFRRWQSDLDVDGTVNCREPFALVAVECGRLHLLADGLEPGVDPAVPPQLPRGDSFEHDGSTVADPGATRWRRVELHRIMERDGHSHLPVS
jgi:subtilisin family serine protease